MTEPAVTVEVVLRDPDEVQAFRCLLPEKQQAVAQIAGVTARVATWDDAVAVTIRFRGLRSDGSQYKCYRDHWVPDLDDSWLPMCFPDPRVRHLAQQLLDDRREKSALSAGPGVTDA